MAKLQPAFTATWAILTCVAGSSKFDSCGVRGTSARQSRIVNGFPSSECQWPWQAGLYVETDPKPFCGGTLIAEDWVLTAAHCVSVWPLWPTFVMVGDLNVTEIEDTEVRLGVEGLIEHPNYNPDTDEYDFALLKLATPAPLSECIRTACLPDPDKDFPYGEVCHVTGWGDLFSDGFPPEVLHEAPVIPLEDAECLSLFNESNISLAAAFCAVGERNGLPTDTCQGDSGGPLVCVDGGGAYTVQGVTSWGIGCAQGTPGVYAGVASVMPWITAQLEGVFDPCDTFSWPNVVNEAVCGICKSEIPNFMDSYGTCGAFCESLRRSCVGAWVGGSDWCEEYSTVACDEYVDQSWAICQCSEDLFDPCDTLSWPDVNENPFAVCDFCTKSVPTDFWDSNGTCGEYCSSLNRSCVDAWAGSDHCEEDYTVACDESIVEEFAICKCSDGSFDPCGTRDWPNVPDLEEAVCKNCKAEIYNFSDGYGTCGEYCSSVGRSCVGAWMGGLDWWCQETSTLACEDFVDQHWAICECSEDLFDPCDTLSWPDVEEEAVCGSCRAEIQNFTDSYGTCGAYCRNVGRSCVGGWNAGTFWCEETSPLACEERVDQYYVICECSAMPQLLYPTPQLLFRASGLLSTFSNTWLGWYMEGYVGSQTDGRSKLSYGKQEAYDKFCLYALAFKDWDGTFALYELTNQFYGMTLLQITQVCMPDDPTDRMNTGMGPWLHGHCDEVGYLKESNGRNFSPYLRLGVGDGTTGASEGSDWALFMPVTGNGGGDFQANSTWAFASKGETCTGYQNMVYIEGYKTNECWKLEDPMMDV